MAQVHRLRPGQLNRPSLSTMAATSTLERIRQQRRQRWLLDLRERTAVVGARCLAEGIGIQKVLLFGSRARGDYDGLSDTDLIAVGITQRDAEAAADALAAAGLGDDLIALSQDAWERKASSSNPIWRAAHAEALPLYERPTAGLA